MGTQVDHRKGCRGSMRTASWRAASRTCTREPRAVRRKRPLDLPLTPGMLRGVMCLASLGNPQISAACPIAAGGSRAVQTAKRSNRSDHPSSKRRRGAQRPFGAPPNKDVDDDDADYQPEEEVATHAATSASSSSRQSRQAAEPGTLASSRVIPVSALSDQPPPPCGTYAQEVHRANHELLLTIPSELSSSLLKAVAKHRPEFLTTHVLCTYFARCDRLLLSSSIPQLLSKAPLARFLGTVGEKADALRIISLRGLTNLSDEAAQKLFTFATRLEEVDLSGCARISAKTLEVLVSHNPRLHTVNISYTDAGPAGLEEALLARRLRVLKAADVLGLTGKAVTAAVNCAMARAAEVEPPFVPLLELRKLKVKNTIIDEVGLGALIKLCGARLESLDISYTALRTLMSLETGPVSSGSPSKLQKLVLNGLNLSKGTSLSQLIEWSAPSLLNLQCSDIDDKHCWRWITRLEGRDSYPLRKLVIGDTCFRMSSIMNSPEICRTFPSLKGNVHYLGSEDPLLQRLEEISAASKRYSLVSGAKPLLFCFVPQHAPLRSVDLSDSGLSRDEVADLVLRSPFMESINLTGCRSIPVQQRRSYFEHFDVAYANEIAALREQHPHPAAMFR
ncbi:hypothetical protein IE81DRAFT_67336 [Ceraceosorus guamensis]|uniref:RNI-like protein n=1 Tax=Ceraceosorus guamensis TaxID=1522189 RepID=A0A316W1K2_9BASI|nr:hypothetical protein IE81DRAFT_67336 [Ceraceosorus guamensis]PWN43736.1 hypothetical protein IE81DRAFT_67336 [Ceraceosorus guamensis]